MEVESAFGGSFNLHVYAKTVDGAEHLALVKGDVSSGGPVLVRVHAVNALQDMLGIGATGDATSQIAKAMQLIAEEGRGVIVLIRDLGPHTMSDWVAQQRPAPAEHSKSKGRERRQVEIGVGSQILRDLGVTDMTLLTNTDAPVYVGVEAFGMHIVGTRRIEYLTW